MKNSDIKNGLDFHPIYKSNKKSFSFTLGDKAQTLLEYLNRRYSTNLSKFINDLLEQVSLEKNIAQIEYPYEKGKYRECRLLLRNEVADFIEAWQTYGIVGRGNIGRTTAKPSTPIEIARKLSSIIANDTEVMQCDSNIYGATDNWLESKFKRCREKSQELPDSRD